MQFPLLPQTVSGILGMIALVLGLVVPSWAVPFGYSVRGDEDTILYKIDLATGLHTKIGTGVGINDVEGLAFDPTTGILYGADDEDNQLITIDITTGVGTPIGPLGVANGDEEGEFGLAIDPTGNVFLFNDFTDELYSVNKSTGAATKIGATNARVDGLAFLGSTLYGVDPDAGALFTINTSTGLATFVGVLGVGFETQSGLAADGTNLWGLDEGGVILRINPTTGAAVQMASTIVGFEDLAIQHGINPIHKTPHDLDGDGKADIVWRNTSTGSTAIWLMNGATLASTGFPGGVPLNWQIAAIGDVNGDGRADVIWRHATTGAVALWLMNGTTVTGTGFPGGAPVAWALAGTGDLNGDGQLDLVWRNTNSGAVAVWLMNGTQIAATGFPGGVPLAWHLAHVGDVDGDGKPDVIWRHGSNGTVAVWLMNGLTVTAVGFSGSAPTEWAIAELGDVDGNGTADLIWRNTSSGAVVVWLMNGTTRAASGFFAGKALEWAIAQVGDVDGDGKADVIWRNSSTGVVEVWLMNGLTIASTGSPGTTSTDWEIQGGGGSTVQPPSSLTLTVTRAGSGNGTVISIPPGINCGTTCSASFAPGTSLTLTATPAVGSTFAGWSGGGCRGTAACKVSLTQALTVTAIFTGIVTPTVTNISGNWFARETVTATCTLAGEQETFTQSGSGTVTINQNGRQVSYIPSGGTPDFIRTGLVTGNSVQFSGKFIFPVEDIEINFTQNIATANGPITPNRIDLTGTGIARGTVVGFGQIECTGNSTATFTR